MDRRGLSRWEVGGVVAGLVAYVYLLGVVVSWARFSAAGVPADQAVSLLANRVLFMVGLRSLVVVVLLTGVLYCAALLTSRWRWDRHKTDWENLPTIRTGSEERFMRVAAGLTTIVISGVFAVAAGGWASRLPGTGSLNDALIAVSVTVVFAGFCATFMLFGPWLLKTPLRRAILTIFAVATALVSALPLALLIVVGALLALLGRVPDQRPATLAERMRTRLPYVVAAAFTLVGFAYDSLPPVSFPRAEVSAATATKIGGYVGRTDDGVYLLTCRGDLRGHSVEPALTLVPRTAVTAIKLGGEPFRVDSGARGSPLELAAKAIGLADRDLTLFRPEIAHAAPTCAADAAAADTTGIGSKVLVDPSAHGTVRIPSGEPLVGRDGTPPVVAQLLRKYQPTVEVTVEDRFWPVAVSSVLQEAGRDGKHVCLAMNDLCKEDAPVPQLAQLDRTGAKNDYLDLPEALASNPDGQFEAFMRGQGFDPATAQRLLDQDPAKLDPWATAQVYAYFAGKIAKPDYYTGVPYGLIAIQYWFYYPYNYYPVTVDRHRIDSQPIAAIGKNGSVDQHEGDWEQVTVFLNDALVPQYLYLARHDGEGVALPWSRLVVDQSSHPVVQAAFGGHPSYPNACGAYPRPKVFGGNLFDFVVCGSGRFAFRASTTALANLARAPWACWPGHFGEATEAERKNGARPIEDPRHQVKVAGPVSPLWQKPNRPVCDGDPVAAETAFAAGAAPPGLPAP